MSENTSMYTLGRIGLNIRGSYDAAESYAELDVVSYAGSSYVAKRSVSNVTPSEYGPPDVNGEPTESADWALLSQGLPVKAIDYALELPTSGTEGQILFVPLS